MMRLTGDWSYPACAYTAVHGCYGYDLILSFFLKRMAFLLIIIIAL